jgi:hypothetical protein
MSVLPAFNRTWSSRFPHDVVSPPLGGLAHRSCATHSFSPSRMTPVPTSRPATSAPVVYEIVNPSDPYTLASADRGVACATGLLLGEGRYGLTVLSGPDGAEGAEGLPIFLFNADECLPWFQAQFGMGFGEFLAAHRAAIAECLESVRIGSLADRVTYQAGLDLITEEANRVVWRDRWHEQRRSSMNNIGGAACRLAAQLRAQIAEESTLAGASSAP